MDLGTLLSWQPEQLRPVVEALVSRRRRLVALQDELDGGAPPASWVSGAATAALGAHDRLVDRVVALVTEVAAVADAVDTAAGTLQRARRELDGALDVASGQGLVVDRGTGRVTDGRRVPDDGAASGRQRIVDDVVGRIEQALRHADDGDRALADVLTRAAAGMESDAEAGLAAAARTEGRTYIAPPRGADPERVNAWWNRMTAAERNRMIAEHPRWIGNLDGVPAWARDNANRGLIDVDRRTFQARLERAEADLLPPVAGSYPAVGRVADPALVLDLRARIAALDAVEGVLARGGRQLLVLDVGGERVKAAVSVGNLDTADHVAVFTPGLNSNVGDSLDGYDQNMQDLREVTSYESEKFGDGGSVAVVTWLGYEAPQLDEVFDFGGDSVATDDSAREGGDSLAKFYSGINASRDVDPHLTALGHSYGSTTTGFALQQETGVDDAVVFGSPGIGTSDIGDVNLPAGHLFRVEAALDPVADLGAFGVDPTHLDGVQGLWAGLSRVDGEYLAPSFGHSEYLTQGTTSQHNLAAVIAGAPDRMVQGDVVGKGDILSWLGTTFR